MRDKILLGAVALSALVTLVHCKTKTTADEKTCEGAAALTASVFKGSSLPPKTLALTFDDGPGDRTSELSLYLKEQGIEAGFFVNGMRIDANAGPILQGLVDDGHIIANHTETHISLTGVTDGKGRPTAETVVNEITQTDAKIAPYVKNDRWLFRPPFGDFDGDTLAALAPTPMNKYVGPISWDVGDRMDAANGKAADWDCWQDGADMQRLSVQACGDLYLTEIRHAGRGIVLMHDPYFNDLDPAKGGTVDMIKYIVPILKAEGFNFVRVDKVPDIDSKLTPLAAPGGQPGGEQQPGGETGGQPSGGPTGGGENAGGENPCP
jgi:peptidoglycan-N-acetylglucosamine deacetylase